MRLPLAVLSACLPVALWAQEAPPGATSCTGCHGLSPDAALSLSGKSADEIATAVEGFRDGSREGTVMTRIAPGFSDDEIAAIAEWFAAHKE